MSVRLLNQKTTIQNNKRLAFLYIDCRCERLSHLEEASIKVYHKL